jgi:hypothetical protein
MKHACHRGLRPTIQCIDKPIALLLIASRPLHLLSHVNASRFLNFQKFKLKVTSHMDAIA